MNRIDSVEPTFYQDTSRLKNLKGREGLEAAAGAFEAMFLQMVLKNMRDASAAIADKNSFTSSDQQNFYQEMADGQMASEMAKRGNLGIAAAMIRQMGAAVEPAPAEGDQGAALKNSPAPVALLNASLPAFAQPLNQARSTEE